MSIGMLGLASTEIYAQDSEWIQACVWDKRLADKAFQEQAERCLGWQTDATIARCGGSYSPLPVHPLSDPNAIELKADEVSFHPTGPSDLRGHVQVQQNQSMITARTAQVFRNEKTHQIDRVELDTNVHFMEPGRLMIAKHASLNPQDKSGLVQQVLYRFATTRASAQLPAWGTADWVRRFANQNYHLHDVTYTTCAPKNRAWDIKAKDIQLNHAKQTGVARHALLRLGKLPILYTPYLSFPTSSARKSGFLMPYGGYTNVNGFDFATPYYLNLAPNYDATVIPHYYTLRGWMLGGNTRFLTERSSGVVGGTILPKDDAFKAFLAQNSAQFPSLQGEKTDRWSVFAREYLYILPNLNLDIDFQQVSDDYYLQDFSTNLAISSENQLLRRGSLVYTSNHWLLASSVQSYQTLHPINQSAIGNIYDRLPQVLANGVYHDLPLNSDLNILGQFDYFHWTGIDKSMPQGARYHLNPIWSIPRVAPWGYITPNAEWVQNNYELSRNALPSGLGAHQSESFNRTLARAYLDSGLTFERDNAHLFGNAMRQTLEPRLYYLYVPYLNQSQFAAFDSGYMIFNADQLFRTNRFSGFDRIGDANHLAYAVTTRWLSPSTGQEKAKFTIGQIRYFSPRKVQLCYSQNGQCTDDPFMLGYTSPTAAWSPIAMQGVYSPNYAWTVSSDFVWDPVVQGTNNANLNLHYQPDSERIVGLGYNYLASGNVLAMQGALLNNANFLTTANTFGQAPLLGTAPLSQITGSYAWPFSEHWSTLGVYSYNITEQYDMLSFFGVQYDTCCWAARLVGGRTFKSLNPTSLIPQYDNNVYFQILLKGLGSAATSNPETIIRTYLPGYRNMFHR